MDTQAQKRAIVDKLLGAPQSSLPSPAALDEPWRTIYRRVSRAKNHIDAFSLIWKAAEGLPDRESLTHALIDLLPPEDAFTPFPSLQQMSAQFPPVDWLWPSWIPRGLLTLFGAAPGVGKSLVALDLARRLIHGDPFPDGAPVPCPGSRVLIVDAEGAPTLLNQRAQAWDIDRHRLFLMLAPDPGGLIDLAHPDQQRLLIDMVRDLQPSLVVVDSLAAATARGETSLQSARDILGFLSTVARQADLALLLIHHLRKRARSGRPDSTPQVVADDLRGSSHISAAARSVLALSLVGGPPPSPTSSAPPRSRFDGLRRLEVVKTNLCRHPPPLGLTFEGENVPVPTLHYAEFVEPAPPPTHVERCAQWLLQFLTAAGAPVKPAGVVQAAAQEGYPRRTLYRARQSLADLIVDLGNSPHDPGKRWALAPCALAPCALAPEPSPPLPEEAPLPTEGTHRHTGTVAQ